MKNFIIQVNSKQESQDLGFFLNDVNISTDGFFMDHSDKSAIYAIRCGKVIKCTTDWSNYSDLRLLQDLQELRNHFNEVKETSYEIY